MPQKVSEDHNAKGPLPRDEHSGRVPARHPLLQVRSLEITQDLYCTYALHAPPSTVSTARRPRVQRWFLVRSQGYYVVHGFVDTRALRCRHVP